MIRTPTEPESLPAGSAARRPRIRRRTALLGAAGLALAACSAPDLNTRSLPTSWSGIQEAARGQTVSLWMWGGDPQGNAYVDDVLVPAAARQGITLRRVPVADTKDALNRILAEKQAGRTDGEVDLVWVNGENFGTGKQADAWRCGWTDQLPSAEFLDPSDPLLSKDFGTDVGGCEAPWHKAQFAVVYDSAQIPDPPTTLAGIFDWAQAHPGRFTYPAPPDFTGSVFVRQALYSVSGGWRNVPLHYDQDAYDRLTPPLWERLRQIAPALWRQGRTYPRDSTALDQLYADGQVHMTMTYGPATLTSLVDKGTFPATTKVLSLQEGTVGNASFLAIPVTSPHPEGAMVVADLAMSPQQQAAKADPSVWGQFTVLAMDRLDSEQRAAFEKLPASPVVPPYEVLSRNANPELAAEWVSAIDEGWRRNVLAKVS